MYDNALLLEGGAMRGLYTAGVLDAFMEADWNSAACMASRQACSMQ